MFRRAVTLIDAIAILLSTYGWGVTIFLNGKYHEGVVGADKIVEYLIPTFIGNICFFALRWVILGSPIPLRKLPGKNS